MHVFLTGISGFSGAYICHALLAAGHVVNALVRPNLNYSIGIQNSRLNYIVGDLSDSSGWPKKIDAVIHAAARSPDSRISFTEMVASNVQGTSNLVKYGKRVGARCFVYLSSLSIYGEVTGGQVDEYSSIINPDFYGQTKLLGEKLVADEFADSSSIAIRLPGIVGPNSVRNWLTETRLRVRMGDPITIYNPESMFNNVIHVLDLAKFVTTLLNRNWLGFSSVTVGAQGSMRLREVVELLISESGSKSVINIGKSVKPSFLISNEKAYEFGYDPLSINNLIELFAKER
jgi:nucleoside-diphosphate-sugar epimerase